MPTENRSSNTEMVSVPEGYMLVERSIWTEKQVEAATACITRLKGVHGMRDRDLAMAALDAAQCAAPDIALSDLLPAEQHQGEPIMLTAVATLVDEGDGGLEPSWLLEGGTAELFAGMTLLVAENAPELCHEDGSAEVYTRADPGEVERLRTALKFYADREHYHFESGNWDTVSGEPLNILWCGDEPDFIEDGSVARAALERQP
ncbi:hypothetical protein [Pseudomonas faucium]|uniref:hypothetical protein n=1 Tax=Pseudomonas faucium TaxID=2740518 RepID=UPI001F4912E9|nr:hypothetical protein [Pseudomonas faucium]